MVGELCDYTKKHKIIQFQRVNFMVYESYLNKTVLKKKDAENSYLSRVQTSLKLGIKI